MSLTEPLLDLDILEKEEEKGANSHNDVHNNDDSVKEDLLSDGKSTHVHSSTSSETTRGWRHRLAQFLVQCSPAKAPQPWFITNSLLLSWATLSLILIVMLLLSEKGEKEAAFNVLKRTDLLYEICTCITWLFGAVCSFVDIFQDRRRTSNKLCVTFCESVVAVYFVIAAFFDLRNWNDDRPTSTKIKNILLDLTMDIVFFCAGFLSTGFMSFTIFKEEQASNNHQHLNNHNFLFQSDDSPRDLQSQIDEFMEEENKHEQRQRQRQRQNPESNSVSV